MEKKKITQGELDYIIDYQQACHLIAHGYIQGDSNGLPTNEDVLKIAEARLDANKVLDKKNDYNMNLTETQQAIIDTCNEIKDLLLEKNRKYGDAATKPRKIFSKSGSIDRINSRIDEKIQRIENRQDDEDEDVEGDLIGWLILKQVAKKIHNNGKDI